MLREDKEGVVLGDLGIMPAISWHYLAVAKKANQIKVDLTGLMFVRMANTVASFVLLSAS